MKVMGSMMKRTLVLGMSVGLMVALLAGWSWGARNRSDMALALQTSELRGELLGGRAAVLDARVAIYSINFGEASGHLEGARGLLGRANERLKSLGRDDEVARVQMALAAPSMPKRRRVSRCDSSFVASNSRSRIVLSSRARLRSTRRPCAR